MIITDKKVLSGSMSEVLASAGLDWEVSKKTLHTRVGDKSYKVADRMALVRKDKTGDISVFGTVGRGWNPVQNSEAFAVFEEYIAEGKMELESIGVHENGRLVYARAKIPGSTFEPVKGDIVNGYMLFTNPHIYGRPVDIRVVAERLVCLNGMVSPMDAFVIKANHSTIFNPEKAKLMISAAAEKVDYFAKSGSMLAKSKFTDEKVREFFDKVFPRTSDAKGKKEPSKQLHRAMELLETQPGAEFAPGSWWQALNAVTYIVDHEMGLDRTRPVNSVYGSGANRKLLAMNLANEMAAA